MKAGLKQTKSRQKVGRPRNLVPSESYYQQRSNILAKAAELLKGGPLEELSLARIADALELSKASMYYYFKSKNHLMYALYEDYLEEQYAAMSEIVTDVDSKQRLLAMLRCQIQGILRHLEIVRLRLSHFPVLDDPIVERCLSKEKRHTKKLLEIVERAIADGHLPEIDSFLLTELLFGVPILVYRSKSTNEYSPEIIESEIASLFNLA